MPKDPRNQINKTEAVKKHLLRFGGISKATAAAKYNCWFLTQIISTLRKRGYKIAYFKDSDTWRITN